MVNKEFVDIREKILKGLSLAFTKLVEEKKKNNEEFVFSHDGKIIRIKPQDLDLK